VTKKTNVIEDFNSKLTHCAKYYRLDWNHHC